MSEAAHDAIVAAGDAPMEVLSRSLRAMFVAAPGRVLVGGDFSNVEGRVNAWLAGEAWKLEAFRAYDRILPGEFDHKGKPKRAGPDLYNLSYSKGFGVPIESVGFIERDIGKKSELSCGFQGSVGAYLRFVTDVSPIVRVVCEAYYGSDKWLKAKEQYDRVKFHNHLAEDEWVSIKVVVNGWRETNPRITQTWWAMQDAVVEAVDSPGTTVTICDGRLKYMVSDGFLWTRLPSGKLLAYANPRLVQKKDDWLVDEDGNAVPADEMTADEIEMRVAAGCVLQEGRTRLQVACDGKNQKTGKWGTQYLYGGNLCNNAVQGTAREILRFAMHNVEARGWPVVLHVHDECVSEVPEHLSPAIQTCYEETMSILPPWLAGCPLTAKAWVDRRYVK